MKRFIIEREMPGASDLTEPNWPRSQRSPSTAMASLGVPYRRVNSYVTGGYPAGFAGTGVARVLQSAVT
jgi:hypothetical protein